MKTLEERVASLEAQMAVLLAPRKLARIFNQARDEALRQHWEAGLRATEIIPLLNAISGPAPVPSVQAVTCRAMKLKLKRPEGWKASTLAITSTTTWGPERQAALRRDYGRIRPLALLNVVNALPGKRIESIDSLRRAAARFKIRSAKLVPNTPPAPRALVERQSEAAPLTPEEQEAAVAHALQQRETRAFKMFSEGKSTSAVSQALGIPLREACRLLAAHRDHGRKAA